MPLGIHAGPARRWGAGDTGCIPRRGEATPAGLAHRLARPSAAEWRLHGAVPVGVAGNAGPATVGELGTIGLRAVGHAAGCAKTRGCPGVAPGARVFEELDRCINEYGFIGANINPDPTGGRWSDPPLWDKKWWYPLYEKMVALDIPAMIHVSGSCNPHFDAVATHYINGDTTAFVQFMTSDIFKDFPTLKFIIPHGGGAVPYHWGRYRGRAQDMGLPPLEQKVLNNVFFDTCVYHQPGIDLLLKVIPAKNILFASETVGAVQGIDPLTNFYFDDTKRYIDASPSADLTQKKQIFSNNALGVYPRLRAHPRCQGC